MKKDVEKIVELCAVGKEYTCMNEGCSMYGYPVSYSDDGDCICCLKKCEARTPQVMVGDVLRKASKIMDTVFAEAHLFPLISMWSKLGNSRYNVSGFDRSVQDILLSDRTNWVESKVLKKLKPNNEKFDKIPLYSPYSEFDIVSVPVLDVHYNFAKALILLFTDLLES